MATIRKRGDKWQVQIRRTGQHPISRSFITRKDAEAWGRLMEVQADRRDLPADPKALERVTLAELVERYRDSVTVTKRGQGPERIFLTAFLRHRICEKRLSDLTGADFAAYRDERLAKVKLATVKRQLAPIQNMFEIARKEWGLPIRENPPAAMQFNGSDRKRERRLRGNEYDRLIQAAQRAHNPLLLPIIRLAIETGMRRGEILAIRRDHVDLKGRSLTIPQSKNGHSRVIPLTRAAVAILEAHLRQGDTLFPLSANALRLGWNRIRRRAAAPDLRFHDLRHEAISRFFERTLSVPEVAAMSGHRDPRMLLRYAHASRRNLLDKLDAFAEADSLSVPA